MLLALLLLQADPIDVAVKKHEAAVQEAQKQFDEKKRKADEELLGVLKTQAKAAATKGDLARAKKALAKLEELEASSGLTADSKEAGGLLQGLEVREYRLTDSQLKSGKPMDKVPAPLNALGEPMGPPAVVLSLEKWTNKTDRNAVARGFLKLSAPGEYSFKTHNYWGQMQLFIGGKEVNKFRDDSLPGSVKLGAGFHAIVCSAWGIGNGEPTQVLWLPPGAKEWAPIPPELLFYRPGAP